VNLGPGRGLELCCDLYSRVTVMREQQQQQQQQQPGDTRCDTRAVTRGACDCRLSQLHGSHVL